MHTHDLKQLSALLQARKISSSELAAAYLQRIAGSYRNASLHVCAELTMQQAPEDDDRIDAGTGTALTGIPIAHKDIFVTRGWRSTAGSKMLENYTSPFDATVVEQFRKA